MLILCSESNQKDQKVKSQRKVYKENAEKLDKEEKLQCRITLQVSSEEVKGKVSIISSHSIAFYQQQLKPFN